MSITNYLICKEIRDISDTLFKVKWQRSPTSVDIYCAVFSFRTSAYVQDVLYLLLFF